jgi:large subunit ribosomal protein L23
MNQERLYQVIKAPHITEKAATASETSNQFAFRVAIDANKLEVKHAVEKLFDVKVERVQLLKMKGKKKRNRFGDVKKSDWKKAYVRLAEGHDIDFASLG